MRCVSRYSEVRIRRVGSTREARDLLERLPLGGRGVLAVGAVGRGGKVGKGRGRGRGWQTLVSGGGSLGSF